MNNDKLKEAFTKSKLAALESLKRIVSKLSAQEVTASDNWGCVASMNHVGAMLDDLEDFLRGGF